MALLFSFEGSSELTLGFSGLAVGLVGDSFFSLGKSTGVVSDLLKRLLLESSTKTLVFSFRLICRAWISIEGHNRVSGKGFPTTGPRVQAENVVIHRELHVTVQYVVKHWSGCGSWSLDGRRTCALRICASFGSTRLICASFGSTRLICASFGSTRLICASFGSTRLIYAFYGTTRLLCRVGVQRGADRREAGRVREGHMDASGFLFASAMCFVRIF
ncbi:hypothetical protein E6C27_scaffold67G005180 [Cucumis melo var. makuwa]|uniref:DNA-directed RNA polymerase I subunit RPA1-like n=1 Tax=Cucumis melo var. makuwa TaxID=1194695 RepID=A0A5A7TL45_CUCMM|nr:hypothetical protein E6C27_scaffold67G005180 [Cucumis melo var. makuwa]